MSQAGLRDTFGARRHIIDRALPAPPGRGQGIALKAGFEVLRATLTQRVSTPPSRLREVASSQQHQAPQSKGRTRRASKG
jgi:hypothetical protein